MKLTQYPKISELSNDQKGHLAWRLDHKTYCGFITAGRIARGEFEDYPINKLFEEFGMTKHQAKIHARKVIDYVYGAKEYKS